MYTGVPKTALTMTDFIYVCTQCNYSQEAQLPQRNIASATHVILGWLIDRAIH